MTDEQEAPRGPIHGDAYGRLMEAYVEDEEGYEIVERDDGYVGPSRPASLYFTDSAEWPERVNNGLERARGRVLDIGCGAGRHALALRDRGHAVVGIDVSARAADVARGRGVADVRHHGIEELDHFESASFETVLLLGNNFGLVGNADRAPEILAELARVTTEDAVIIAESRDPHRTEADVHLEYHTWNREHGYLPGRLRLRVRYERYATDWFEYLLVSPDEMAELLGPSPWAITDRFDSEDRSQYVAILEKRS